VRCFCPRCQRSHERWAFALDMVGLALAIPLVVVVLTVVGLVAKGPAR